MIRRGIKIGWWSSDEYISIDLGTLSASRHVADTLEYWRETGEVVQYNVDSNIEKTGADTFRLTLTYARSNNTHLGEDDVLWGTSTIYLDKTKAKGKATWKGELTDENDGDVRWQRIYGTLIKEIIREQVSRIQREQQQLRKALLATDRVCALTGEALPEVLDAAHLIPSKLGGAEVIENAILLRADLHRLLDARRFTFDGSGNVIGGEALRKVYGNMPADSKLPEKVLARVRAALKHPRYKAAS